MLKARLFAFSIHLAISLVIFVALATLIYSFLYPGVLFTTDGGIQGIKIIAGVDLVIGPLLTLIIYNPLKKKLKQDLIVISGLQLSLLAAGMYLVYDARPVAVIFSDGKFHTMSKASYAMHDIDYRTLSPHALSPKYYIIPRLQDPSKASERAKRQLADGPIYLKTKEYSPYSAHWQELKKEQIAKEKKVSFGLSQEILSNFWIIPFEGRYFQDYVLVNKNTGALYKPVSPSR